MAFLTKYRKYSRKDEVSQEEVEYNYGRAFHGIGTCMHSLTTLSREGDELIHRRAAPRGEAL